MKHIGMIALSLCAVVSVHAEVIKTTANNGNLVMENVPSIPTTLVDALNRYQNVRSAPFRAFTQDGNSILVSTRFGEVSQLHRVDMAGGARHQLTFLMNQLVTSLDSHIAT